MDFNRERKIKKGIEDMKMVDMDHRGQLTIMLKVIHLTDLDEFVKFVMRCNIWGLEPDQFAPMSPDQIFIFVQKRMPTKDESKQMMDIIEHGKFVCTMFCNSVHAQEIIDKFNEKGKQNLGQIFAKIPSQQKRFSV